MTRESTLSGLTRGHYRLSLGTGARRWPGSHAQLMRWSGMTIRNQVVTLEPRFSFRTLFLPNAFVRASRQVMMRSHRSAAFAFVALVSTLAFSASGALAQTTVTSDPPASFTLSNGLKVVVIPDHRTPVVTQMVWYKVGSADETPGKSGLAHFLEHLMFKGTAKHPVGEFSQTVLKIGGNENAFTSNDYTGYFQRIPREKLPLMMEFEADRMTGLVLKDENVLPERDVVLEEYNMRVANNPDARLAEQIMAALYLNHPYGRPVIGWHQEIEKLDREDALAFYRRFYAPNNATLVIAGDVTVDDVRPMVEASFGKVASQPQIPARRISPQEPEPIA